MYIHITAREIDGWAGTVLAKGMLPVLIRRLCLYSSSDIEEVSFPGGDRVFEGGFDGVIINRMPGSRFLPGGPSVWELSTQAKKLNAKADDDYNKRSAKPLGVIPQETTYVAVMGHEWGSKRTWSKKKREDGIWKDVIALDAHSLQSWLEASPPVAAWFARQLERPSQEMLDLEGYLDDWERTTNPPLPARILKVGRRDELLRLQQWEREATRRLLIQADDRGEALAFAAAALEATEGSALARRRGARVERLERLSRAVVAKSKESYRWLLQIAEPENPPTILADFADAQRLVAAGEDRARVIVGLGRSVRVGVDEVLELPRTTSAEIAGVLAEDLDFEEAEANACAAKVGGSIPALQRRFGLLNQPAWLKDRSSLWPVLALVGAWDPSREVDRAFIRQLGVDPEELEAHCEHWRREDDSPLRWEPDTFSSRGGRWTWRSREEAWESFSQNITDSLLDRFEDEVVAIFERRVRFFTEHQREETGSWFEDQCDGLASEPLERGILEGLILLSLEPEHFTSPVLSGKGAIAGQVVRALFSQESWYPWAALSRYLSRFAEAAPKVFLECLEAALQSSWFDLEALRDAREANRPTTSPEQGLVQALGLLAWSPQETRAVKALARLASRAEDHELSPAFRALQRIVRPVLPQRSSLDAHPGELLTYLDERVDEDLAWRLRWGVVRWRGGILPPSAEPRYRAWVSEQQTQTDPSEIFKLRVELLPELLATVNAEAYRWGALFDDLSTLVELHPGHVWRAVESAVEELHERDDFESLLSASRLAAYQRAQRVEESDPYYELLIRIVNALETPELRQRWLFRSAVMDPRIVDLDYEKEQQRLQQAREDLLQEKLEEGGLEEVLAFAATVEQPWRVGLTLASLGLAFDALIKQLQMPTEEAWVQLARRYLVQHRDMHIEGAEDSEDSRDQWLNKIKETLDAQPAQAREAWEPVFWGSLDVHPITAAWAESMGESSRYWRAAILRPHSVAAADTERFVRGLADVGRWEDVFTLLHIAWGRPIGEDESTSQSTTELALLSLDVLLRFGEQAAGEQQLVRRELEFRVVDVHQKVLSSGLTRQELEPLATIEPVFWPWLLGHRTPYDSLLFRDLESDPNAFVDLVQELYLPDEARGDAQEVVEQEKEISEEERARASFLFQLLHSYWRGYPGRAPDEAEESYDEEQAAGWAEVCLRSFKDAGYEEVGAREVGRVLGRTPDDEEGRWPAPALRDVLEEFESRALVQGMVMGRRKARGVVSKDLFEGGEVERARAGRYREMLEEVRYAQPWTAELLEKLIDEERREAERWDVDRDKHLHSRLYRKAESHEGYFSLSSDELEEFRDEIEAALESDELEEVYPHVYKLRSAELHEEHSLLLVWLWAKEEGVFSHETAMSTFPFSEALPSRIHITLPTSWETRDLELPPGVKVYFRDLNANEVEWYGEMRRTRLERTLSDMIDQHQSTQLVVDSIATGYTKGLLSDESKKQLMDRIGGEPGE